MSPSHTRRSPPDRQSLRPSALGYIPRGGCAESYADARGADGNRQRLLDAYHDRPWLTWVHTHVGSQGCPLDLIAQGIAKAVAFADEVNATCGRRQVTGIDIGGGLPVNFADDETTPGFDDYVAALQAHAPALFTGEYEIVTEFGRSLLAKNGFTSACVEYTKVSGGRPIAITHAGAQVATRTVFMPAAWPLRLTAHSPDGTLKQGEPVPQDIAGLAASPATCSPRPARCPCSPPATSSPSSTPARTTPPPPSTTTACPTPPSTQCASIPTATSTSGPSDRPRPLETCWHEPAGDILWAADGDLVFVLGSFQVDQRGVAAVDQMLGRQQSATRQTGADAGQGLGVVRGS
ncbi:hypothetical protein [Streptomyces sp. WM6386]|uniref:hypothetical protein n=1 Tax=Streptomyces sp. WM6386 TaxID=1415558 RepID=UPI003B640C82